MKKYSTFFNFYSFVLISLLIVSCSTKSGDPFDQAGFNAFDNNLNKRVEAYFDGGQPQAGNLPAQAPKVYIDFSNGLVQAYAGGNGNAAMLEKITQKLTGPDIEWFGLGRDMIYPLDFPTTQLFNKVTDPQSYASQMIAPIEDAVKLITSSNSDALLVTDFEEYTEDKKEQFENFAKGYFIDWLSRGNSINFFITKYNEKTTYGPDVEKRLYFIVFNYGVEKKLLGDINYALKERGFKYETFSLSTEFYTLTNEYGSEKKGGNYYDEQGTDILCVLDANQYINGLKRSDKNFEFYAFLQPWGDISKDSKSLMEAGVPKPFTDFFRKLYINASNDDVFQLKGLEVKVSDVTNDFLFFSKTREAKKHKPLLAKDANGNSIFAETESDPIALSCYDTKGNLLTEWEYKPLSTTPLNEVFELNSELYKNGFKESKNNIEIGTKYHPNFDGTQITNPGGLLRVDIVISECNPNFEKLNDLFSWKSTTVRDKRNESLSEAIRNTLKEVNPQGKAIYSYFIKTAD